MKVQKSLDFLSEFYKRNYKKLLLIPIFLFLLSMIFISITSVSEGVPIYRDISLKGGLSSIFNTQSQISLGDFTNHLTSNFPNNNFKTSELFEEGTRVGFIVDTDVEESQFISSIEGYFNEEFIVGDNYVSNFIAPSLSAAFFFQAISILIISFVFMSLIVFLYFRKIVPSIAVILSVVFDVIVTIGILNMMKFEISIAGIGALLMLIGYSIDTDILLTNRVFKEIGENYFEKAFFALKTGTLMTLTTLSAGFVALIFTNSDVIFEIALILVIGLTVDYISTWLQNMAILIWWLDGK